MIDWKKKLGTVVPNLLTHGLVQTPGWAARVQTSSATGPPHHPGAPQLGATGGSLTGRETHLLPAVPRSDSVGHRGQEKLQYHGGLNR